jgi:hypothetical protein
MAEIRDLIAGALSRPGLKPWRERLVPLIDISRLVIETGGPVCPATTPRVAVHTHPELRRSQSDCCFARPG